MTADRPVVSFKAMGDSFDVLADDVYIGWVGPTAQGWLAYRSTGICHGFYSTRDDAAQALVGTGGEAKR